MAGLASSIPRRAAKIPVSNAANKAIKISLSVIGIINNFLINRDGYKWFYSLWCSCVACVGMQIEDLQAMPFAASRTNLRYQRYESSFACFDLYPMLFGQRQGDADTCKYKAKLCNRFARIQIFLSRANTKQSFVIALHRHALWARRSATRANPANPR